MKRFLSGKSYSTIRSLPCHNPMEPIEQHGQGVPPRVNVGPSTDQLLGFDCVLLLGSAAPERGQAYRDLHGPAPSATRCFVALVAIWN